jgi:hypothetical protein
MAAKAPHVNKLGICVPFTPLLPISLASCVPIILALPMRVQSANFGQNCNIR